MQPTEDVRVAVRFTLQPKKDDEASAEAGRPVFKDVEYVEIRVPGDKLNIVHRPIREEDRQRFAISYNAWKQGLEAPTVGTPLAQWPGCTRGEVETLAYSGIRTVEQLANVSFSNAQSVGPIQHLIQKAKDYLETAKSTAHVTEMRAELEKRDAENAALRQQVKELAEAVSKLGEAKADIPKQARKQ